ncbi:MAG: hypothetical protein ABJ387_00840 [Balneola sp.]
MVKFRQAIFAALFLLLCAPLFAQNNYQVTLLRAAPGELGDLIEYVKKQKSDSDGNMMIMRHSQGDHWDLMLMTPFSKPEMHDYSEWVDFQHDFLVESEVSWKELLEKDSEASLYHIEMFNAARGLHDELLKQRAMENIYYNETNRDGNVIFVTKFGSDVDNFTLGFYKDMIDFATDPDLTDKEFEDAALKAGFESRATIGLYLRKFLVGHNDTIARKVN